MARGKGGASEEKAVKNGLFLCKNNRKIAWYYHSTYQAFTPVRFLVPEMPIAKY
jgi:hypothetical protein